MVIKYWEYSVVVLCFILFWFCNADIGASVISCCIIGVCLFIHQSLNQNDKTSNIIDKSLDIKSTILSCKCNEHIKTLQKEMHEILQSFHSDIIKTKQDLSTELQQQKEEIILLIKDSIISLPNTNINNNNNIVHTDLPKPELIHRSSISEQLEITDLLIQQSKQLQSSIRSDDPFEAI